MADLKISQLSSATALAGTEVVPVVQGGSTKKATIDQILSPAAGKGIDFSANGGDVLTQYDEGIWTPNQGPGLTVTGTFTSTGTYTRIGRQVTIQGSLESSGGSISVIAGGQLFTNAPFTVKAGLNNHFIGGVSNGTLTTFSGIWMDQAGTIGYSVEAQAATGKLLFTVTYFI